MALKQPVTPFLPLLQPGVRGANIQAGFVSHNYQGLLLTAGDGAVGAALRGVVFSHISVMQVTSCMRA